MSKEFKREERYQVIKLKTGKPVDCVVVEADWPEYEVVWKMIEDRMASRYRTLGPVGEVTQDSMEGYVRTKWFAGQPAPGTVLYESSAINQLRAELATEREKVKELDKQNSAMHTVTTEQLSRIWELEEKLAAAQATIEKMRAASYKSTTSSFPNVQAVFDEAHKVVNLSSNLDALHEARAQECERLAKTLTHAEEPKAVVEASGYIVWLRAEAAAHRAKKGK